MGLLWGTLTGHGRPFTLIGMLKKLVMLAALIVAFGTLSIPASSASSAPSLTCNIQPSSDDIFSSGFCGTNVGASSYGVVFWLQGASGSATYTWTYPAGYTVESGSCTSTSDLCVFDGVSANAEDVSLTVSVAVHVGGTTTSYSDTAFMSAVCGDFFC